MTRDQARDLFACPDLSTLEGKRDRAILAVLLGCALRRSELAVLTVENLVQREGRWVFLDLQGKGRRLRTVPVPAWVKVALDAWTSPRALRKEPSSGGSAPGEYKTGTPGNLSERMIWHVVTLYARKIGLPNLRPTICAAPAPSSATPPSRPPNVISAPTRV